MNPRVRVRGWLLPPLALCLGAVATWAAASQARALAHDAGGLPRLHHVLIGVNSVEEALAAYQRLGFRVTQADSAAGGAQPRIELEEGFVAFVGPQQDSTGQAKPFTFEGAIAQGWQVQPLDATLAALRGRGMKWSDPDTRLQVSSPEIQPISGTAIYLGEFEGSSWGTSPTAKPAGGADAGTAAALHPNGARRLAYVTVATQRLERPLEILRSWGLVPGDPVEDVRGSRTVKVPLARGTLYLTSPTSGGGINDFLQERRALAPPVGDRFYEGSILSIGLGVDDLDATEEYFEEHGVPFTAMDLPSGHALVVQGAPGWGLRLEFVQL